ncbi:MAG: hypothetical protein KDD09_16990 [Phaeodactylibacter sp.]|nr:hypothetical protein [Phaeodactylibacter sp.]
MRLRIIIAISLWSLLAGCGEDNRNKNAVEAVIDQEVARRIQNYKQVRMDRCYEKALEEASRLADSILILEARLERDTLGKPPKPEKPEKPEIKAVLDSTPIKPLLEGEKKSTPIDSLEKN